jgi:UDP-N-acetylmuramoyl-L-alanyl-D-glutamate--2,6-diaminopimelate ligase
MADAAARLSDLVILTSDNPRSEDPEVILDEMEMGIPSNRAHERQVDRRKAIAMALNHAQAGDMILVTGKGHETYQEISGVKSPFDDREVIIEEYRKLSEVS